MRRTLTFAAASRAASAFVLVTGLATSAASAQDNESEYRALIDAGEAFFAALRSEDKSLLRPLMHPDGVIYIHNRMGDDRPALSVLTSADYLDGHETVTLRVDEVMRYTAVRVDGDMGHLWGPFRFLVAGQTSHCGINSMNLAKTDGVWQITTVSFTREPPERCAALRAPEARTQEAPKREAPAP